MTQPTTFKTAEEILDNRPCFRQGSDNFYTRYSALKAMHEYAEQQNKTLSCSGSMTIALQSILLKVITSQYKIEDLPDVLQELVEYSKSLYTPEEVEQQIKKHLDIAAGRAELDCLHVFSERQAPMPIYISPTIIIKVDKQSITNTPINLD